MLEAFGNWSPIGCQNDVVESTSPIVVFEAPRASGKTEACFGAWLAHAAQFPNATGIVFFADTLEIVCFDDIVKRCMPGSWRDDFGWLFVGGSRLGLHVLESPEDVWALAGHSFSFIAIDNAEDFDPTLIARILPTWRSNHDKRLVLTNLPGATTDEWLQQAFLLDVERARPPKSHSSMR